MDLQNLLLRFGGRINRARYWIGIAAISLSGWWSS
jgi:uncharacterized membrane protein YhaH (DUF805 family)